jgi:hypothetical protein
MATWVPMPCPVEGCGYMAQFQLEKTKETEPYERTQVLQALSEEHPDHPDSPDSITTTGPPPFTD